MRENQCRCGFATNSLLQSLQKPGTSAAFPPEPMIRLGLRGKDDPMTKNELIAAVADSAKLTKTAAATAVESTFDIITGALKRGDEVKLIGFGSFSVVQRKAREGRNPRTGEPVQIKASKAPKFSAGKGLKDAVNI
jgi:DNA-binding protein HU-beta